MSSQTSNLPCPFDCVDRLFNLGDGWHCHRYNIKLFRAVRLAAPYRSEICLTENPETDTLSLSSRPGKLWCKKGHAKEYQKEVTIPDGTTYQNPQSKLVRRYQDRKTHQEGSVEGPGTLQHEPEPVQTTNT